MNKLEKWEDIENFETYYMVSNFGRVKSLARVVKTSNGKTCPIKEKILNGSLDTKGYIQVELRKDGKRYYKVIHRLVAEAFIPNLKKLPQVNHKDGNKTNNNVDNLEWCTCKENIDHCWKNGLNKAYKGEKHPNHKLTNEQAKYIKENYTPRDKKFGARALAREFGITPNPIYRIISGKGWNIWEN